MVTEIWVNIGSGNGLLPDGTKPLLEPMLTSSVRSSDIHLRASSQELPQPSIIEIICKIKYQKFHSNFPGANGLTHWGWNKMATISQVTCSNAFSWMKIFKLRLKFHRSLTNWGWVMHICVSKLTIIGSDNGWVAGRRQTIIWTNDRILLIGPLGTNFSEILVGIQTFLFKKMHLKISSAKWRPFCLSLNVLSS